MVAGSSSALTRYAKRIYNEPARGVHDCAPWGKICFFFRFDTITEKQENGRGFFLFSLAFHYHPPPPKKNSKHVAMYNNEIILLSQPTR